mmetsp:Transcript_24938/g.67858  ORF Transcript_24938/g.67858 Transcript_24938/m.67858 type:complete len:221 (+) Transcript_24938:1486-2148(+)
MDTQAHFHLALLDAVRGGLAWQGAHTQCHPHGAAGRGRLPGSFHHLLHWSACLRHSSSNLVDQDGACNAAPASQAGLIDGQVITHSHHLHLQALRLGLLSSQAKVQAVTSVVHDDEHAASRASGGADGSEDGMCSGGGKHLARHASSQHAWAYEACVAGLVASTTTRDDGHVLALVVILVQDDLQIREAVQLCEVGVLHDEPIQSVLHEGVRAVHQLGRS